jgi:methionyl-tRNA formyltransferase
MIKKIAFLSSHISGYVKLKELLKNGLRPYLITAKYNKDFSGHVSFNDIIKNKRTYKVKNLRLDSKKDIAYLKRMKFDILLISGWHRIVEDKILRLFKFGAIAEHGSYNFLPFGKGRSPAGWTLRKGKKIFILQIFRATGDVDEGILIDYKKIKITDFDNINTLYYKIGLASAYLTLKNLKNFSKSKYFKNPPVITKETFFRKILHKDDFINWNSNTSKICNLVRACESPYPMAKSYLNNKVFFINKVIPFDYLLDKKKIVPGTIVSIFPNKNLLVKTKNSLILITEYFFNGDLKEDLVFKNKNF